MKREEFEELFQDESAELAAEEDCPFESDLYLSLPPDYVPQDSERISLYRELDNLTTEEEVKNFRERLEDRFGRLPRKWSSLSWYPFCAAGVDHSACNASYYGRGFFTFSYPRIRIHLTIRGLFLGSLLPMLRSTIASVD